MRQHAVLPRDPLHGDDDDGIWRTVASTKLRKQLIPRYAWTVSDPATVEFVLQFCGDTVIDPMAGSGYWARLLVERGVFTLAYDRCAATPEENHWHRGVEHWTTVLPGEAVDTVAAFVRDAYVSTPELEKAAVLAILAQSRGADWWIDHRDFRTWFLLVKKHSTWIEALAQIPAGATLARIEQEFAHSTTRDELDQAIYRADVAKDAGQITTQQFDAFETLWLKRCAELQ